MTDLVLYGNPQSRSRVARWMLEEVGQPYRTQRLDYGDAMRSPEFIRLNPMGKVPVLVHGDTVVTENAAICAYLADAFPAAGLAPPPGSPARGPYYRWLFFTAGPVEAATTDRVLGFQVPAGRERMVGYGTVDQALDTLEGAVAAGDYLAGGAFSAADVYVGAFLMFGLMFGSVDKRPAFERYVAHLLARPAAIRARELDDGWQAD